MDVAIIGGGIAGLCTALDLKLRGFNVSIFEKGKLGDGTTTKCAGMLHSGARYVNKEIDIAKLCYQENQLIKKILPYAVDNKDGLFIALKDYDMEYVKKFEDNMKLAQIKFEKLSYSDIKSFEENISENVTVGFSTPDAVINPYLIVEAYREELDRLGVIINENFNIKSIKKSGNKWDVSDENSSNLYDIVINATGSWVNDVCKQIGINIDLTYIHGSMAILEKPLVDRVVTACAPNRTGDVIIPSGNRMMVGSTWHELNHNIPIVMSEVDKQTCVIISSELIPQIKNENIIGSFTGIRTHEKPKADVNSDFAIKRNYSVIDHSLDGFDGIFSILAGKLSFGRLVAEEASNLIVHKYKYGKDCVTREYVIPEPKSNNIKTLDITD